MNITLIMRLKYFSWLLTVGTAFIGCCFFEYTITEKETGPKKLTVWGRRGVVFAGLALVCSLGLTPWTDCEAAHKPKGAEEEAARGLANAAKNQRKVEISQADIKSLAEAVYSAPINQEDRIVIRRTVISLAEIEGYKVYPDTNEGLMKATSFTELSSAINKSLSQAAIDRISNKPECADIPRSSDEPMVGGFPGGHFMINGTASVTYMITSDYVRFGFTDAGDSNSLGHGSYKFLFADGSQSSELQCTELKTNLSCDDRTSDDGARAVYADLQKQSVIAIRTNTKTYPVSESTAQTIRTTFSCISP